MAHHWTSLDLVMMTLPLPSSPRGVFHKLQELTFLGNFAPLPHRRLVGGGSAIGGPVGGSAGGPAGGPVGGPGRRAAGGTAGGPVNDRGVEASRAAHYWQAGVRPGAQLRVPAIPNLLLRPGAVGELATQSPAVRILVVALAAC